MNNECEYCGEIMNKPYAKHYRGCRKALVARREAASGLASVCDDESAINIMKGIEDKSNLYQLHYQNKKDLSDTEMVDQKTINNKDEMRVWWRDMQERRPLPEGFMWMCCDWESEHFIKTV